MQRKVSNKLLTVTLTENVVFHWHF